MYDAAVVVEDLRHARAERVVDALGVIDVDAEPARREQLHGEHLDAGNGALDRRDDVPGRAFRSVASMSANWFSSSLIPSEPDVSLNKNGRLAPISSSQ